ncbi:MAG: response regulator transcription factor [Kofleriaceae bacterium]|nr:response regulator transcription factor [Kofleriaceae bacterium]
MATRFLLIDDHALLREGLALALTRVTEQVEVVEAESAEQAVELLRANPPFDLILLDMQLPGRSRLEALDMVRELAPRTSIVVLSAEASSGLVYAALKAGARGYIHKGVNTDVLLSAVQLVFAGGIYVPPVLLESEEAAPEVALTNRQEQVLVELTRGATTANIASTLEIAEVTVRVHIAAILRVLRVESREQAVRTPTAQRLQQALAATSPLVRGT